MPIFAFFFRAVRQIIARPVWIIDHGLQGRYFLSRPSGKMFQKGWRGLIYSMNYALINAFLKLLENYKTRLTPQQYRTLRGQASNGDVPGARRGLERLIRM
jgi:hypothetical protein